MLHCNSMLVRVAVMVYSRDLRLVCVGRSQAWHKPKDRCHFQSFESMHWKKSQHQKHLLMHLNGHFKNVSMSQSHYLKLQKRILVHCIFWLVCFQSIYTDIVTENPVKWCNVFVQLQNSIHWGACSSFLVTMIRNRTNVQICALWSLSKVYLHVPQKKRERLKMERSLYVQYSFTFIQ